MEFQKKRMEQLGIKSMGDMLRSGELSADIDKTRFTGIDERFDPCFRRMSRGDLVPILGASGGGKTSFGMLLAKSALISNPDEIFIFISLEMREHELAPRWQKMCKDKPDLWNRFYVITAYDKDGKSKGIKLSKIKRQIDEIKSATGKRVCTILLDHLHLLKNEEKDLNKVCCDLKDMAVESDSVLFVLSQIPKGPKQAGDIPIEADDAFGVSDLKWLANYVITIHRPLERVREEADLNILAWQYAKVREEHEDDKIKPKSNRLLIFEIDKYDFRELNATEITKFKMYYEQVLEMREAEEKKKSFVYELNKKIKKKDGTVVEVKEEFTGMEYDEL